MAEFDFIVPFRARSTTRDWAAVCRLLEQTLASILNSDEPRIRVLVVCHEKPDISFDSSRCCWVSVDFEPPAAATLRMPDAERLRAWRTDKGRKLLQAVAQSKAESSRYFMVVDADDLVSSRLARHCLETDHPDGYFIDKGFRFDERSPGWVVRRTNFFEECGSSLVLRTDRAPFPAKLDLSVNIDDHFMHRLVFHSFLPRHMAKQGQALQSVPFAGGLYRIHDQNTYADCYRKADSWPRRQVRHLLRGQRITQGLRAEFTLRPPVAPASASGLRRQ